MCKCIKIVGVVISFKDFLLLTFEIYGENSYFIYFAMNIYSYNFIIIIVNYSGNYELINRYNIISFELMPILRVVNIIL